jgi:hypothetical protein
MLIGIFIIFEIIMIIIFFISYFTKHELLWAITLVLSAVLMINSFYVETYVYQYNSTISAYSPVVISSSYIYLMGINMLFFGLSMLMGLYDVFEKYGINLFKKGNNL